MKFMTGWIVPEMNWALKLDSYSCSFCLSKSSMTSSWRPKTFTTLWPVKTSSIWPSRSPVRSHCAANCFCERRAMNSVATTESGTTRTEMRARIQLIESIMSSTPTMVRAAVMSCVSVCCRVWEMLSMSFVIRLRTSPRGWSSKYLSGRRESFSSTACRSLNMERCATPAMRYCCNQAKSALTAYTAKTSSNVSPMAWKSTPLPGCSVMAESMSATRSWPLARRAATAWSCVTPGGNCLLMTPSKRMFVA